MKTIWESVMDDDLESLKKVLKCYPETINEKDNKYGFTPLAIAAYHDRWDAFDVLIDYKEIDINAVCHNESVLFAAVMNNYFSRVEKILTFPELDINYKNRGKNTALEFAISYAQHKIVKLLISHGASMNNLVIPLSMKYLSKQDNEMKKILSHWRSYLPEWTLFK